MQNIAVLFGGKSVEHDISIITGMGVIKNLSLKYNIVPIYIDTLGNWWTGEHLLNAENYKTEPKGKSCFFAINKPELYIKGFCGHKKIKIDCAVLALHGGLYEGGAIQGLLELAQVPYTSAGVMGSAVSLDKVVTKHILANNKINTTKFVTIYQDEKANYCDLVEKHLDYPVIVKPARCGSSIGIKKAVSHLDLEECINYAFQFDDKIIVEECLTDFRELNISAFRENGKIRLSAIEEVVGAQDLYNFSDKYQKSDGIKRILPADLNIKVIDKIAKFVTNAYILLDLNGIVRMDMFLKEDKLYLNEINTIPGSLAFYLWREKGYSFSQLLNISILQSMEEFKKKRQLQYTYKSDVLSCLTQIERINNK